MKIISTHSEFQKFRFTQSTI